MKVTRLIILILFLTNACVDSFNLYVDGTSRVLVVDGLITNEPGPYAVKLFWSSNVGDLLHHAEPVNGATVEIFDDEGSSERLQNQGSGIYQTASQGIQGIAGRTYHVEIITPDGETYSSTPELLAPPGTIDSLYFEFKKGEAIVNGQALESDGFNIYVNARGNDMQSIIRWSWTGTYKVLTHPELEYGQLLMPRPYAPDPCSGYICGDATCLWVKAIAGCTCCTCYITENQGVPFLSDGPFGSNSFQKYQIAFIPFEARNFLEKYHLQIQQFTMTNNTYQFWKLVQSQIKGSANLFQPPIAKIKGNIVSTLGRATSLGIFSACGIAEKTIWIYRSHVPFPFEDPLIRESCQLLDATSTTQVPSFWN